jgi:hypothetical protein
MPRTHYKVWSVGAPVGQGITGAMRIGIATIAKTSSAQFPRAVANELICNHLARTLMLPCPPGALIEHAQLLYFAALDFNVRGQSLPPANPILIVHQNPELAWGIILFDVLIMNEDRHTSNISHDRPSNDIQIFDHSHALLGPAGLPTPIGFARVNGLSIGNHCLAKNISLPFGFDKWVKRINLIPDYAIEDIVAEAIPTGLPPGDASLYVDALKFRRGCIENLVRSNLVAFPLLPQGAI